MQYYRKGNEWVIYSVGEDGLPDLDQHDKCNSFKGPDLVFRSNLKSNEQTRREWPGPND